MAKVVPFAFSAGLLLTACLDTSPLVGVEGQTDGSSTSTNTSQDTKPGDGTDADTNNSATTSSMETTSPGSTSGLSATTDVSTTDVSTTDASTTDASTTGSNETADTEPQPGVECTMNERCAAGACFVLPVLGGVCGECVDDSDCEFGCSPPNYFAAPPLASVCNMGMLGEGCQTTDVCVDDLLCTLIFDLPGIFEASTCSECATTDDCGGETVCNVSVRIEDLAGEKTCVDVGSVPDGEFCDLAGDGELACTNHCATADAMSLALFGVCSECREVDGVAQGCEDGQTCVLPTVDLLGDGAVVPGFCE